MERIKRLRNEYIKAYDMCQKEKHLHDNIISYYRERWRAIQRLDKPLQENHSYEENYLWDEFETYRRRFEKEYDNLRQIEEKLSMDIVDLNIRLGYDEYDLDSDKE